jgi:hypothetical protein
VCYSLGMEQMSETYIVVQTTAAGEDVGYWEDFKTPEQAEVFRSHRALELLDLGSDDTFSITDQDFNLLEDWN